MGQLREIAPRRLEPVIARLMTEEPVVVLNGPRTVGKSTLLRRLAEGLDATVLDLDDLTTRELVRTDPSGFAAGQSPVLIDEFQHVPEILDAIKAELNIEARPGRFVLTGSTRYSTLPAAAQSLTGRVDVETVWPLSQGEQSGVRETFVERLLDHDAPFDVSSVSTTRSGVVERVLAGGLPAALQRAPETARPRWWDNYVAMVIERDVLDISRIRQRAVLPDILRRLTAQTGQVLNVARASREAGVQASTGDDYVRLLESVFLVHRLPAWGTTLAARVHRHPKIHVMDTGLGGHLMGLTAEVVERRLPSAMSEFGHLLESFVVNELLKQVSWLDRRVRPGHYRTADGVEVDLVLEAHNGDVVALEVKAGSTYRAEDLRGLLHLQGRLGPRLRRGVLLYTGSHAATVGDGFHLVPVEALWH